MFSDPFDGPGLLGPLSFAPPLFQFFFLLVLGIFVFVIGRAIVQAVHNMGQPLISRQARIIGRRQHTSHSHHNHGTAGVGHSSSSTSYYLTFEFEDGSREEFRLNSREFGLLVEGDEGTLHSQGTWFKGFDRQRT